MNKKNFALITGASSGIGFECSKNLAKRGYNLILIARSKKKLMEMKQNLEKIYEIECVVIVSDLIQKSSVQKIINYIEKERLRVEVGILNAGFGDYKDFEHSLISTQLEMIQLNISSLVELTHGLIPIMKRQKSPYMLHIASTAAFQPIPQMSVYAATKSFVLSFSQAIREELKNDISITTLCPGPTKTHFAEHAHMNEISIFKDESKLMSAKEVATQGLDAMFKKKAIIVPGIQNRAGTILGKLIPTSLSSKLVNKIMNSK